MYPCVSSRKELNIHDLNNSPSVVELALYVRVNKAFFDRSFLATSCVYKSPKSTFTAAEYTQICIPPTGRCCQGCRRRRRPSGLSSCGSCQEFSVCFSKVASFFIPYMRFALTADFCYENYRAL